MKNIKPKSSVSSNQRNTVTRFDETVENYFELYEANLGSGLYKKRVALLGKGKSGGYRTLVAFKKEKNAFFVYGFAKRVRENINEREKKLYRQLAKDFLAMDEEEIQAMIKKNKLYEVK